VSASFDPLTALRALVAHDVAFLLVGGLAGRAWGSPTVTNDLDVCYARTDENLERLAAALQGLGARLRGVDDDVPFLLDALTIRRGMNVTFTTSAGALDVLGAPAGTDGYDDLAQQARRLRLADGLDVLVVSLDDLIRMKRAAARRKDLIEVEVLEALREERARIEPSSEEAP